MESMGGKIVGGADDFEIEVETRKQPKGGYMYFYMTECQRMKEGGKHIGSVRNDVLEKWNSMSDADKEPYIAQSKMDSEEYKEWRKEHEKKIIGRSKESTYSEGIVSILDGVICKSVVEVSKSKNWKALASKYGLKQKVTYHELEEEIKSGSYGRDELKARVLLYLVGIFLYPTVLAYERTRVARIRAWGKEEVVRVMVKLKLDRPRKQERRRQWRQRRRKNRWLYWRMMVRGWRQSRVEERLERVEETLERHKREVQGKIDGVVKEVEVLRGEVEVLRGEVEVLRGELKMVTSKKIDGVVKEVVELRSELTGVVEKADNPSGIDDIEAAICDYLWNSGLESGVSDVATLKPTLLICSLGQYATIQKKSLRRIVYLPYHLAQQALDTNNKVRVEDITSFWGLILCNYVKFTDCEKIMITTNYHNSHWYLLVLDMMKILDSYNKKRNWVEACGSLGNLPLKNFKFMEHKMNEQVNGYDCSMYVMMRMELIGSTGATSDFVVGQLDRSRILNDLIIIDTKSELTNPKPKGKRELFLSDEYQRSHNSDDQIFSIHTQNGSKTSASEAQSFSNLFSTYFFSTTTSASENIRSFKTLNFRFDTEKERWQRSFKVRKIRPERVIDLGFLFDRVKDVGLDQEMEKMNPIGYKDDQPIGVAMMEEAPEAPVREDVTIKTVMEYMVNFREHIDSLVSGMRADISSLRDEVSMLRDELHVDNQEVNEDEDDDDYDDPNKYIVSTTPPARKLVIFEVNGVITYFPRQPKDNFVVAIWSSKMRHNIDPIVEKLPLLFDHFLFTWDQANCKTYANITYCKDLNDVWNVFPHFNDLNILLVDDSPEKMIYNPKYNYICPHSFDVASHSNNNALEKGGNIREYLENLLKAPNVPNFVRNNPFSSD
ncbi:hypothetical protein F3Y22_tig00110610pilonHSYRG00254 [Hibiscus syriacus]|uniref:HMG box domain-containing protein n=1 Tax=Hibiscus syriacus TaxID=106335 RepID=A0A6A3A160_HIBSY|nr:hypothetical protein F3Y22_tig00110610pilonHSYRG00254 [Hibiscus syriacus]